jgi:tRNA(Ile)-lysidine synthase
LLDVPKARLIATCEAAGIAFTDDPANRDPRFARTRLRAAMPQLAAEGLDAARLAVLARRLRRVEEAINAAVQLAAADVSRNSWSEPGPIILDAGKFARLPAEVALRLLGRAIMARASEGPVQLARLETLSQALSEALNRGPGQPIRLRRTLAGALISLEADRIRIETAPPRRRARPQTGA